MTKIQKPVRYMANWSSGLSQAETKGKPLVAPASSRNMTIPAARRRLVRMLGMAL